MNKQIVSIFLKDTYGKKAPSVKKLKKDSPRVYNALYDYTDYLPKSASITERSFNVAASLEARPLCKCGKVLKFKNYKSGYSSKCSKTCKG